MPPRLRTWRAVCGCGFASPRPEPMASVRRTVAQHQVATGCPNRITLQRTGLAPLVRRPQSTASRSSS